VRQWRMEQCKHVNTPARPNERLSPKSPSEDPAEPEQLHRYQQLVGSLLYAAITTRADIMWI